MLVKAEQAYPRLSTHPYLTDVVGIDFSLNELRQVCWQAVLVQDFLPFGFVSDLEGVENVLTNQSIRETFNDTGK